MASTQQTRRSERKLAQSSSNRPAGAGPDQQHAAHLTGLVIRAHGLWFEVAVDDTDTVLIATLRGQLKRSRGRTDIVAVGDRVQLTALPDNEAVITEVEPRIRSLVRTARNTRDTEQVILANPDQVLFVFAARDPEPHIRMLDRFIILAELQEVPIRIVVTKMDLVEGKPEPDPHRVFHEYLALFPVHFVSTRSGEGMDDLLDGLQGRITAVAGPSGVGKSSLLNVLDPVNDRETAVVSTATGKGRHTTVGTRIHRLDETTFVADTPGMRSLAMHATPAADLAWCYREFRPFLDNCRYHDCTHVHEPTCAVREAVHVGEIGTGRYDSYVLIRTGGEIVE